MTDHTQISLEDLGDGYAAARFHEELKRVLANIDDPNTDWKKVRKIKLEVTLRPFEDRSTASMDISVTSSLAPAKAKGSTAFIGRDRGQWVAYEHNPKQLSMPNGQSAEPVLENDDAEN